MAAHSADTCDPGRLRLLLEDRLDEDDQAALEAHLGGCERCRVALERLAATSREWGDARQLQGDDPAGADTLGFHPGGDDEDDESLGFLDPPGRAGSLGRLGPYEVEQVLGRGGMGIVLKAHDAALDRAVAIKVLAAGLTLGATARRRFAREARAAAAVAHEHVVAIHAVDEFRGLPYLVMQFVPGRSLQERLDATGPLDVREVLRIGLQTARALAAAHAQGVIHRDIKPANILLENCVERVRITDFGLARTLDDASLTCSGVIAGTPQYMAPEQARGEPVDARADLYALGAVLYAMTTGRPPFRADSALAVLKRVCEDRHRRVRDVNPDTPAWLENLIDRLLAKEPADRPTTAAEVATLLEQGLAHIQHPATHEAPALDPAGCKVSTTGGASVPASNAATDPEFAPPHQRSKATALQSRRLPLAAGLLGLCALLLGFTEATGVTQVADTLATVLRIKTDHGTLVVAVDDPSVKVQLDGQDLVITGAGPQEVRVRPGTHHLRAVRDGQPVRDELITISRGGKQVVNVALEPTPIVGASGVQAPPTPVPPGMGAGTVVPFAPLGLVPDPARVVALPPPVQPRVDGPGFVVSAPVASTFSTPPGPALVWSLAFSPDGKTLAIGQQGIDNQASALRVVAAQDFHPFPSAFGSSAVRSVAYVPGQPVLVAGHFDGTLSVHPADGGQETRVYEPETGGINAVAVSRDGRSLVVGCLNGVVTVRDFESGEVRYRIQYPDAVYTVACSPTEPVVAFAGKFGEIWFFDLRFGGFIAQIKGSGEPIESLAYSPDGKLLASASWDRSVRLWEVETRTARAIGEAGDVMRVRRDIGKERATFEGHERPVLAVAFSPDGKTLASADGLPDRPHTEVFPSAIRLWDVATGKPGLTLLGHTHSIYALAFQPDGKALYSGGLDQSVRVWDPATGALVRKWVPGQDDDLLSRLPVVGRVFQDEPLASSQPQPDRPGRGAGTPLTGDAAERLRWAEQMFAKGYLSQTLLDAARREAEQQSLREGIRWAEHMFEPGVLSENQREAARRAAEQEILRDRIAQHRRLLDLARTAPGHGDSANQLEAQIRDLEARLASPVPAPAAVDPSAAPLTPSPEPTKPATPNADPPATPALRPGALAPPSVDLPVSSPPGEISGESRNYDHGAWVRSVAVSPDGRMILSGGEDKVIRLWDLESGKPLHTFEGHQAAVSSVAFSPDGGRILSGSYDRTVRLWDVETGKEVKRFDRHGGAVASVAFSPDGRRFVSGGGGEYRDGLFLIVPETTEILLWDVETGREIRQLVGHSHWVHGVAFSPDGRRVASCGLDNTVRVWDAETGRELHRFGEEKGVWGVAFSPDGRLVASAGDFVRLWDAEAGWQILRFSGADDKPVGIGSVAFSPDGRRVLSAGNDKLARLWDAGTARELVRFQGHGDWVSAVAFSPDGRRVVSGSKDGTVRLWNVPTLKEGEATVTAPPTAAPGPKPPALPAPAQTVEPRLVLVPVLGLPPATTPNTPAAEWLERLGSFLPWVRTREALQERDRAEAAHMRALQQSRELQATPTPAPVESPRPGAGAGPEAGPAATPR